MKAHIITLAIGIAALFFCSCSIEDKDRCGGDTNFYYEDGNCQKHLPPQDTQSEADDSGAGDTGTHDDEVQGLGDPCSTSDDCTKDADYCAASPGSDGYCTVADCTVSPNDCPDGYQCCDITVPNLPNFCATDADFSSMGAMCAQ